MRSFRKLPELSRDEMLLAANTARQRFREERVASERRWSGCYDEHFETAVGALSMSSSVPTVFLTLRPAWGAVGIGLS